MTDRLPLQDSITNGIDNRFNSEFDKKGLHTNERPFSPVKEEEIDTGRYYSPSKKRQRFRFHQNIKTQHCKQILSQVQNLKVPKKILQNKDHFYAEEYVRFQEEVPFKEFKEFDEMLNNETIVTIEYFYEERSKFHRELNESMDKFTTTALELADIIQRRFPFIDVIIKNLKKCDEIQEFHPYGLFEVQIVANQGAKTGILYSKKISYILPSPNKIVEEIYFFVEKTELEVEIYDILQSAQVITPGGGCNNKDLYCKQLEGVEVILRQKVFDYQVNKEGKFILYGLSKPVNKNEILTHTLGSSKSILYTRANELDASNINISGELTAHSKQNPVKTFMTKSLTNSQGIARFKDLVVDVDSYEIEVSSVPLFHKEKQVISLKQLLNTESRPKIYVPLKPKNIAQVSINLFDELIPLSGAVIRVSNAEVRPNMDDENGYNANENQSTWICNIQESTDLVGNYSFLAEPGSYYVLLTANGYTNEHQRITIQKGENVVDVQMSKKVMMKVNFVVVDAFTTEPLSNVELVAFDQAGERLSSGVTDELGQFSTKAEMMTVLKILTRREDYIDIVQDFMANASAITEKISVKMIPKDKSSQNDLEIITSYPEDIFNVSLQIVCPDHSIVNERTPNSQNFNVKYDELIVGRNAIGMITYKSDPSYSTKKNFAWEFEVAMTLKSSLNNSNSNKLLETISSNSRDLSLPIDCSGSHNTSQRKSSMRLSATSLFLSNRVSPMSQSHLQSFRGSCSSIRHNDNHFNETDTKLLKSQEDIKNIVDLNNCLRVYIISRNTIQDVLYCCLKNLGNKVWRIGTIHSGDDTFTKINSPDLKEAYINAKKEEVIKVDPRSDSSRSSMLGRPGGGFGVKDSRRHLLKTGDLTSQVRANDQKTKARVTEEAKLARLRFARKVQRSKLMWRKTFITDECSFWLSRSKPGKIWTQDPMNECGGGTHGEKLHLWGAIYAEDPVSLEIFRQNLIAAKYIDIRYKTS